jgi:DNA-directed RNA polymerase specialized sigma24 family protein
MKLLDWWRRRRRERGEEAEALAEMRRVDEPEQPVPDETYLSQTRD